MNLTTNTPMLRFGGGTPDEPQQDKRETGGPPTADDLFPKTGKPRDSKTDRRNKRILEGKPAKGRQQD
ncbi:MAG: hypothetical protein AB7P76_08420 [Candidatus Melainabacteria bacterium]